MSRWSVTPDRLAAADVKNIRWHHAILASTLKPRAKLVGCAIAAEYADFEPLEDIWPGVDWLCRDTNQSPSTVQGALDDLVAERFMVKVRRGGTGRASEYRGTFPRTRKKTPCVDCGAVECPVPDNPDDESVCEQ
jgi:hypothetical protein